jgi:hypothetical protein
LTKPTWQRDVNIRRDACELVLVYIGGYSCGACNDPEFKEILSRFKLAIAGLAQAGKRKLRTIGVSSDWDVDRGLQFLRDCGPWDEVVVGNNWYNSAVIEHIWNLPDTNGAIPQVIVFERSFVMTGRRMVPSPKRYLIRLIGKREVSEWLASGSIEPVQ